MNAALREMEIGNARLAQQGAQKAQSLAPTRDVQVLVALVWARIGDPSRARALIAELESKNPFNTVIKAYWLPTLKASLELRAGNPQAAIRRLQVALPYELGEAAYVSNMYPAYLRGQAYLLAHDGSAAAAEFKKLLDHPGIVQNDILGALTHLQLARAKAALGDKDGARKQYNDFLSLWNGADPDVPVLKEARAEYAKLQ
jgi:ATP/maltotriose-dependent transcriptional regulator MalT